MNKCIGCGTQFELPGYLTSEFCSKCENHINSENFEHISEIACFTCRYFRKWYNPCSDCVEKIFWNMNPDDVHLVLGGLER